MITEQTFTYLGTRKLLAGDVVYFAYSAGRIKIGFSTSVAVRRKQIKAHSPFDPVVILVMEGSLSNEGELHIKFAADRVHGEWFTLSKQLRSYLNNRLCHVGITSLDKAEAEFRDYCQSFIDSYQTPPKTRSLRKLCAHLYPVSAHCQTCERERDLKILEELKAS